MIQIKIKTLRNVKYVHDFIAWCKIFRLALNFSDSYIIKLIHVDVKSSIHNNKNIESFLKSYIFCKLLMIFFKDINYN